MNLLKEKCKLYLIIITIINTLNIPTNVRSEDVYCPGNKFFMCQDKNSYYSCEEVNDGTVKTDELKQCGAGLTCDIKNNQPCVDPGPPTVEYCPNSESFICQDKNSYYLCEEYFNNTTVKTDELKRCGVGLTCDKKNNQPCVDPGLPIVEYCPNSKSFVCQDQNSYYLCEEYFNNTTVKSNELRKCADGFGCDMKENQPCVDLTTLNVEYCPSSKPFVCQDQNSYYLCEEYFNDTTVKSDELQKCADGLVCDMDAAQHCTDPALKPELHCKDNETIINSTCGSVELIIQIGEAKFTLTVDDSTHVIIPTTDTGKCETLTTPNGETRAICSSSTGTTQDQCGHDCDPNVIIEVQGGSPETVTIPSSDTEATLVTIDSPVSFFHRLLDDFSYLGLQSFIEPVLPLPMMDNYLINPVDQIITFDYVGI